MTWTWKVTSWLALFLTTCCLTPAQAADRIDLNFFGTVGAQSKVWVSADYLLWQTSGMKIPALVTGNPIGTAAAEAGVIGISSTQVLLGDGQILDDARNGMRFGIGAQITEKLSIEGEYFQLFEESESYIFDGSNNLVLGRPFINLAPLQGPVRWDSQVFHFPPITAGSLRVHASSELWGTAARLKWNLCGLCAPCADNSCDAINMSLCDDSCDSGFAAPGCVNGAVFFTIGHRYLNLDEQLRIDETLIAAGDRFDIYDDFSTSSEFNGIEFGLDATCNVNEFFGLRAFGRVAVGANNNRVRIAGQTTDVINNVTTVRQGGILAQSSNIGTYDRTIASIVSEIGINASLKLTSCLAVNAGYSGLYWGNVARPGEQIDLNINPNLFPPQTAVPGTIGAQPTHRVSDLFAHGLNAGVTLMF